MSFFSICNESSAKKNSKGIPLRVIRDRGIEVTPQIDIGVTDLLSDKKNTVFKNFYNRGYGGITFTIEVIFKKTDNKSSISLQSNYYPKDYRVLNWVDYYIKNMIPVYVVTEAIDIKNGLYIITDNSRRTQTYKDYTVWSLEFTTFTGLNSVKFTKSTKALSTVIKKYKRSNTKTSSKKKTSKTAKKSKLAKCKTSQLKYTGNKVTNVKCVKYMQEVLYKKYGLLTKRQVDGWYGPKTKNAIKKFQKKKKLKQTGTVNSKTLKALCT